MLSHGMGGQPVFGQSGNRAYDKIHERRNAAKPPIRQIHAGYGACLQQFDENIHVIEPFDAPKEWYDTVSIDPGLNNPLSAHFYAWTDDNIYVIAEHYERARTLTTTPTPF